MISNTEYNSYYEPYISLFTNKNKSIIESLDESRNFVIETVKEIPKEKEEYVYAQGKWTIKELLQHIINTERVFNYRALRFARNDKAELLGFEQDNFNLESNANSRELSDLFAEFLVLRSSTISLFKSFDQDILIRIGVASGSDISVRAIGYILAGHSQYHMNVYREKYM